MIIMWPLIVSKTVNPNILPGVCKALEKYIYVHQMDDVIEAANKNIRDNRKKSKRYSFIKQVGKSLRLESSEIDPFNYIEEAPKTKSTTQTFEYDPTGKEVLTGTTVKDNPPEQTRDPYGDAMSQAKAKDDYRKMSGEAPIFGKVDSSSINTEPTWNTVVDQQGNTSAIGVKVVPFVIQNESSLVRLLTIDRYRTGLNKTLQVQSRKILRLMHHIGNKTWKHTIGNMLSWTGFVDKDLEAGTITQNWKNDIILQNTTFKDQMFILLNKMDLEDDFLSSTGGVKKLFSLGWTSFIVADDMNKVVNFCMKDYKGLCSMVNYGFLYSDGRSHHQVYKDIDEISSRSGPLFRLKTNRKRMITDNLAQYKLDLYTQDSMLSESDFSDIVGKIKKSPNNLVTNIKAVISSAKRQDVNGIYKIVKKINPSNKSLNIKKSADTLKREDPKFKKNYDLSYMVFKNSLPKLREETIVLGSTLCATIASINKDKNYDIKNDLKKIVMATRDRVKTQNEDNDDFAKDLNIAFAFATITIVCSGAAVLYALYALINLLPQLIPGLLMMKWAVVIFSIYALCKIALPAKKD